jgi:hypothetical protein
MLNAGNELRAEHAGSVRLARLADVCGPYLGTLLSTVGDRKRPLVEALADAPRAAAGEIAVGSFDHVTVEEAATALRLPDDLAASCRLRV